MIIIIINGVLNSRSEMASLIALGLPRDVKEKCMDEIGDASSARTASSR